MKEHLKSFILNQQYRKSKLPRRLYDLRQKLITKSGWASSSKVVHGITSTIARDQVGRACACVRV